MLLKPVVECVSGLCHDGFRQLLFASARLVSSNDLRASDISCVHKHINLGNAVAAVTQERSSYHQ